MSVNLNKKILIAGELHASSMGLFFQELGFELASTYNANEFYAFAVDSVCPEVQNLPRVQVAKTIDEKVAHLVRGRIDPGYFKNDLGKALLKSHFNDAQELNLIERYSSNLKAIYNVKLQDYLNLGFFVDSIVVEAYRGKFDITAMRAYLNAALNFAFKKIEFNVDLSPIEIAYSHDEEAIAVQMSLDVESFDGVKEVKDIFDQLAFNTNYFDITYHSYSNKLVISSLLFKDTKMKSTHSYFFTEVAKRAIHEGEISTSLYSGLMLKEEISYVTPSEEDTGEKGKTEIIRRFALFIKNTRKKEGNSNPIELADLDVYLAHYPRQSSNDEIDDEIKALTFKVLQEDSIYNEVDGYIQKIPKENLSEDILEVQRILKNKSLEAIGEATTVIKNSKELDNALIKVKGWKEEADEIQRISGEKETPNNEIWQIKKLKMSETVQQEITRIRGEGKNIILDDIVRVAGAKLEADAEEIRPVVEHMVEEALASELAKNKKMEEDLGRGLLNDQVPVSVQPAAEMRDEVKEKLQDQNARMKKLMEQMKRELIKVQNEKKEVEAQNFQLAKNPANDKLKSALATAMAKLKTKDRFIEKLKQDSENNYRLKDARIAELELKVENLKEEYAHSKEARDAERVEDLRTENKALTARLAQANKKINTATENIESAFQGDVEKFEKEIDALKLSVTMAQTLIERMKHDKAQMEKSFAEERAELNRQLEERAQALALSAKGDTAAKSDGLISTLTSEKKILEEKLKAQGIELKKAEQKLKFANSQLDSANSNSKKDNKANVKSNEAYAKQLDLMNIRMENATAEVAEKRKELHKLKQENTQLTTKVLELEKKLSIWEKKAS